MPRIPKKINFIWVGTKQPMDESKFNVIKNWIRAISSQNRNFEFTLWVDEKSAGKSLDEIKAAYQEIDPLFEALQVRDISELAYRDSHANQLFDCARYEIDRIEPNYGAASDILRYIIISEFGGAYFDIDIDPGPNIGLLLKAFDKRYDGHVLFVDSRSQKPDFTLVDAEYAKILEEFLNLRQEVNFNLHEYKLNLMKYLENLREAHHENEDMQIFVENLYSIITDTKYQQIEENLFRFLAERCSNDMLIATQYNPILGKMLGIVMNNYLLAQSTAKPSEKRAGQFKYCYNGWNKMLWAISLTGPDIFRRAIYDMFEDQERTHILLLRNGQHQFVAPLEAGLSWMTRSTKKFASLDELLQACLHDIKFEIDHFAILRIDDFFKIIEKAIQHNKWHTDETQSKLNNFLDSVMEAITHYYSNSSTILQQAFGTKEYTPKPPLEPKKAVVIQHNHATKDFRYEYDLEIRPKISREELPLILGSLFLESDFVNYSIQQDFVLAKEHPVSVALWMENIQIAENFVKDSGFFTTKIIGDEKISHFRQIRDIYFRLEQLLNFIKNLQTLDECLTEPSVTKTTLEHTIHNLASTIEYLANSLKVEVTKLLSKDKLSYDEIADATSLTSMVLQKFATAANKAFLGRILRKDVDLNFVIAFEKFNQERAAKHRRESRDDLRDSILSEDFQLDSFYTTDTESRDDSPSSMIFSTGKDRLESSPRPEDMDLISPRPQDSSPRPQDSSPSPQDFSTPSTPSTPSNASPESKAPSSESPILKPIPRKKGGRQPGHTC